MSSWKTSVIALILAACAGSATGQPFWQAKNRQEWSEAECRRLLRDSPWAKSYVLSVALIEPIGAPPSERARETNPRIEYVIQLRSALPVRQALVRLRQIETEYDRRTTEQRQEFDGQAQRFLETMFPDQVVVYVEYGSNVPPYATDLARHWQTVTSEFARNTIFLITPNGERIPPLRYQATPGAGGSFQLTFPRHAAGKPLLAAEDSELKLEFPHPRIGEPGPTRVLVTFKVREMLRGQEVVY